MSKTYKEMEEELTYSEHCNKVTGAERTAHFDATGQYVTDNEIQAWLKKHQPVIPQDTRPDVPHYRQGGIEPIDFINSNDINFNLGNAIKYITRCNYKGHKREDLEKAIDYIRFELAKDK